jgi:hypothetical protein
MLVRSLAVTCWTALILVNNRIASLAIEARRDHRRPAREAQTENYWRRHDLDATAQIIEEEVAAAE